MYLLKSNNLNTLLFSVLTLMSYTSQHLFVSLTVVPEKTKLLNAHCVSSAKEERAECSSHSLKAYLLVGKSMHIKIELIVQRTLASSRGCISPVIEEVTCSELSALASAKCFIHSK